MKKGLKVGTLELFWLNGGVFELDGGTMFGVVPKVLWQKKYPEVGDNYIRLLNSPILVLGSDGPILIETGLGNKLTDKQKKVFRVREEWDIPAELGTLGLKREDVKHVILTHCDFDHAGGVAMRSEHGTSEITFPRAMHYVQKDEWEDVLNPNIRAANSYWPVNFENLNEGKNLSLVEGDMEVASGVRVTMSGGHTRGHQVVWIESEGKCAVHMADLLPTHVHFNPLWIMAYDNFPLEAIEQKREVEKKGIEAGAWFTFYHDPFLLACRFDAEGNVLEEWKQ